MISLRNASICAHQWTFQVQGSGFRVQGSGCRVQSSRFRVQGNHIYHVIAVHVRAVPRFCCARPDCTAFLAGHVRFLALHVPAVMRFCASVRSPRKTTSGRDCVKSLPLCLPGICLQNPPHAEVTGDGSSPERGYFRARSVEPYAEKPPK